MKTYHTIDYEKVKTIKDIILILKAMDLKIVVDSDYETPEEILEISKFLKKEDLLSNNLNIISEKVDY